LINIIARLAFFLFPIPIAQILSSAQLSNTDISIFTNYIPYIPLGFSIATLGLLIGGILDILLPRKFIIGGKIVAKSFNIGTLSWFEGIRFSLSVDVGASGKGISVKDERE
jgi:hypothetical protein